MKLDEKRFSFDSLPKLVVSAKRVDKFKKLLDVFLSKQCAGIWRTVVAHKKAHTQVELFGPLLLFNLTNSVTMKCSSPL